MMTQSVIHFQSIKERERSIYDVLSYMASKLFIKEWVHEYRLVYGEQKGRMGKCAWHVFDYESEQFMTLLGG